MNKQWKKLAAIAVSLVMSSTMLGGFAGCLPTKKPDSPGSIVTPGGDTEKPGGDTEKPGGDTEKPGGDDTPVTPYVPKKGVSNDFTSVMPSNWNEFTYSDNNDTQILNYMGSSLFEYDFEFDEAKGGKFKKDGSINKEAIVPGGFVTKYSAATAIKDVTATVDAKWGYTADEKTQGGYAWEITIRDDIKWDDGTAITADSFIYSMKEILNPLFLNFRANTYYQTLIVKNAKKYFYKESASFYPSVASKGYKSNQEAVAAGARLCVDVVAFWNALTGLNVKDYVDQDGNAISQWQSVSSNVEYDSAAAWAAYAEHNTNEKKVAFLTGEGLVYREGLVNKKGETYNSWATGTDPEAKDYEEYGETEDAFAEMVGSNKFTAAELWQAYMGPGGIYASYFDVGGSFASCVSIETENTDRNVTFEDVGFYKTGDYSFVICMEKSYSFLNDNGSLSYLSAYYMSSLPLVKESLYESCKQAPKKGATLWTSNYNSDLSTTASWGAYKLTSFVPDVGYTLEKNEHWYGYKLEDNKNQYNIEKINVKRISEISSQWLSFFKGEIDGKALDTEHIKDYKDSKYVQYSRTTGTFGMQIYGNLPVLKNSGRNNGILAIEKFRKAFSLSINRKDLVEKIWPGVMEPCYGAMNPMYYYDVLNGKVYRNSEQAKKALLRVHGFTEDANGKWSDGASLTGLTLDAAYRKVTGYNPELAKQLLREAYAELTANAETYGYDPSKNIELIWGTSQVDEKTPVRVKYLQGILDELTAGTELAGKITINSKEVGKDWANKFRAGDYEIGFGFGFNGNPLNPYDMIGAFVDDSESLNYHTYWKTSVEEMTFTLPAGDYEQAGKTVTMTIKNWFECLNGTAGLDDDAKFKYNWDSGKAPETARLEILAKLEEVALSKYYTVVLVAENAGALNSPKISSLVDEQNLFMGFGGSRYAIVNYTESEWAEYVKAHGGNLEEEYKKTAE